MEFIDVSPITYAQVPRAIREHLQHERVVPDFQLFFATNMYAFHVPYGTECFILIYKMEQEQPLILACHEDNQPLFTLIRTVLHDEIEKCNRLHSLRALLAKYENESKACN